MMQNIGEMQAEVWAAIATVFSEGKYRLLGAFAFIAAALISWLLPVFTIPGNSLDFWFEIAPWWSYLILLSFSAIIGVMLPMQIYILENKASGAQKGGVAASFISTFFSSIYSSAACAGCITAFGALIGGGASLFLLRYRTELMVLGALLALASLYFNARTVNRKCSACASIN